MEFPYLESEGTINLRKLDKGELLPVSYGGIENSFAPSIIELIYLIEDANEKMRVPTIKELSEDIGISERSVSERITYIKKNEIVAAFNFTAAEALLHLYATFRIHLPDYIHNSTCDLPKEWDWLNPLVKKEILTRHNASWYKQLRNPRTPNQYRHWIALIKDGNGTPCYESLNLVSE